MGEREKYLDLISKRGDTYGGHGGMLSLLEWCNKVGLYTVTEDEAREYWLHPESDYKETLQKLKKVEPF